MTKILELPNTPDYPLRDLAELRANEAKREATSLTVCFDWEQSGEGFYFWRDVNMGQRPPIPAASIEDLRRAGMMPEPEPVIKDFARVDTAPPPFYCENSESTAGPCAKQCAECAVDERAARKPEKFYCHNRSVTFTAPACNTQCGVCRIIEDDKPKPSITLSDYARMEREEEINELIQTMLTPEELRGYYMGNIIKYRMRAGKKAFTGEDQSDDLFNARNFEGLLAELERGEG